MALLINTNTLQQGRLDFFLVTSNLVQNIRKSDIQSSYKSDHSAITLELKICETTHGKGLWKFNNSLLHDQEYLDCMKINIG